MPSTRLARLLVLAIAFVACGAPSAFASGPIAACKPGEPFRWPNGGTNIPWNPDQGTLGPLNNAQAVSLVASAFNAWKSPKTSVSFQKGMPLPEDVTVDTASEVTERHEKLSEDVDAILDEIDDVLETNAEDFVRSFVQKGGE